MSVKGMHFTKRPWLVQSLSAERHKVSSHHKNSHCATNKSAKIDSCKRKSITQTSTATPCSSKGSCNKHEVETHNPVQSLCNNNKSPSSIANKRTLEQLSKLNKDSSEISTIFKPIIYSTSVPKASSSLEPSLVFAPHFVSPNENSQLDKEESETKNASHETEASKISTHEPSGHPLHIDPPDEQRSSPVSNKSQTSDFLVPFVQGSVIQLENGELKCVEQISTKDLIKSAEMSGNFKTETCRVLKISKKQNENFVLELTVSNSESQFKIESSHDYPFFVVNSGWASCNPDKTKEHYKLDCKTLIVGDNCLFLSSVKESGLTENSVIKNPNYSQTNHGSKRTEVDENHHKKIEKTENGDLADDSDTRVKRKRRWSMSDIVSSEQTNSQCLPTTESLETLKPSCSYEN